jgi:uncharacterized OsmC-like protein
VLRVRASVDEAPAPKPFHDLDHCLRGNKTHPSEGGVGCLGLALQGCQDTVLRSGKLQRPQRLLHSLPMQILGLLEQVAQACRHCRIVSSPLDLASTPAYCQDTSIRFLILLVGDMTNRIASKSADDELTLDRLAHIPDTLAQQSPAMPLRIPIRFEMASLDGIRKRIHVAPGMKGYSVFELISDEGTTMQGTDSAPAPLDYFAAGAAFCLGSHLTLLIHQTGLDVRGFTMQGELWFSYSPAGRGVCLGLRTVVDLDSDEPADRLTDLVAQAKGLCLAEAALANPVPIQTAVSVCGELIDPDVAPTAGSLRPPDDAQNLLR